MRPPILYDLDNAHELIPILSAKTDITLDDLEEIGRLVQERGYQQKLTEKLYEVVPGVITRVFRAIKPGWDEIDGTFCCNDYLSVKKYTVGPTLGEDLCAFNCAIYCCVMLNIGLIQHDQIKRSAFGRLPQPTLAMYTIVSGWGNDSLKTRNSKRDYLRRVLTENCPEVSLGAPTKLVPSIILNECLKGCAQVSYTETTSRFCCSTYPYTTNVFRTTYPNNIDTPNGSPHQGIQAYLDREEDNPLRELDCPAEVPCTGAVTSIRSIILDRLPPTIMAHCAHNQHPSFHDIELKYRRPRTSVTATYRVVGCILLRRSNNHYTVTWRVGNGFIEYDDQKRDGRAAKRKGWCSEHNGVPDSPTTIFYRMVSSEEVAIG